MSNVESTQCTICKFVVSYIDTVIQNNKSEAAIESALEKVCTIVPHALNSSCVQFVQTYGPVLVTLLENYTTPDKVCAALKLCQNGTEQIPQSNCTQKYFDDYLKYIFSFPEKENVGSPQCSLCKVVVHYLDLVLLNNKSEAAIESALEKVCTIFPQDKKAECVQFVDTYGMKAVELLETLGSPDLVCKALGLCIKATPSM